MAHNEGTEDATAKQGELSETDLEGVSGGTGEPHHKKHKKHDLPVSPVPGGWNRVTNVSDDTVENL